MRFMIIMRASEETEAGVLPTENELTEMSNYNQELADAGVLRAGEGLQPSSKGVRVNLSSDSGPVVIDGPFAEAKELIAGFWIFEVDSLRDAVEWVKRCPTGDGETNIEIRQLYEEKDFGEAFTPELRETSERLREQIAEIISEDARRDLVRGIHDAWLNGDMDTVVDGFTDDMRWVMAGKFIIEGKDNFIKSIKEMNMEAMTTREATTENIVVDGNTAAINGAMTVVGPDRKEYSMTFCDVYRFRGEKIEELTSYVIDVDEGQGN